MTNFKIFCFAALLATAGCYSPNQLARTGKYDKAVRLYAAQSRTGQLKSDQKLAKSEWVFALAQTKDLIELQNFDPAARPADWIEVQKIWKRVAERQQIVARSFGQQEEFLPSPNFNFIENADSLEFASRSAAAQFFYDSAMSLLETARRDDNRRAAREAHRDFLEIEKRYFKNWRDVPQRLAEAREIGTTHFALLVENHFLPATFDGSISGFETEWAVFHSRPNDEIRMDFQIVCSVLNVSPGWENISRNCRTESKRIEVGEKLVKDSTGKVVEREVIYENVSAEICEFVVTRTATADAVVKIFDLKNGQPIEERFFQEGYTNSESCISVSGDSRATCVSSSCFSPPSCPSDFWMLRGLSHNFQSRLTSELRWLARGF